MKQLPWNIQIGFEEFAKVNTCCEAFFCDCIRKKKKWKYVISYFSFE